MRVAGGQGRNEGGRRDRKRPCSPSTQAAERENEGPAVAACWGDGPCGDGVGEVTHERFCGLNVVCFLDVAWCLAMQALGHVVCVGAGDPRL